MKNKPKLLLESTKLKEIAAYAITKKRKSGALYKKIGETYAIEEAAKHFKSDKWALNCDYILADILTDLIGHDALVAIASHLIAKGVDVSLGSRDSNLVFYINSYYDTDKKGEQNAKSKKTKKV